MNYSDLDRSILPIVSKKLDKRLTSDEMRYVQSRIRGNNFEKTSMKELVISIVTEVAYMQVDVTDTDRHEYNKSQIGVNAEDNTNGKSYQFGSTLGDTSGNFDKQLAVDVTKFMEFNKDNLFSLSRAMNPASKEYYTYIMFDSDNKSAVLSTDGQLVWQLNDGLPLSTTGTIDLPHKLNKITKMRLGRLTFANLDGSEYTKLVNADRLAVTIPDYSSQAIVHQTGNKFHFIQQILADRWQSDPTSSSFFENRGWFRFHEPHLNTGRISLRVSDMFAPTSPIIIGEDFATITANAITGLNVANVDYGADNNPIVISIADRARFPWIYNIVSPTGIPDTFGDAQTSVQFTISGFTTSTPIIDAALIAAYNGTHTLKLLFENFLRPPIAYPLGAFHNATITITFPYKPRLTGVLELISEIQPGEKIV